MKYQKQMIVLFGALALFTYFSVQYFPNIQKEDSISVMEENKQDQIQIYVLDKDATLIPMAKSIEPGYDVVDKIKFMLEAMRVDHVFGEFTGVLSADTIVENVLIENGCASIYFNDAFVNYQEEQELRLLEAITWGVTQFQDIQQVQLYVNDTILSTMPLAHTPIPNPLNRKLGINHFEAATSALHQGDTITVFYTKEIDGQAYFVPKSKRIAGNVQDMEFVVKEVLQDVSVSSNLTQPLFEDNIDIMDLPRQEADTLIVNMNHALLASDRSAKQSAYEALVLSLANTFDVDKVMVTVEDTVISIHGSNEEALEVSSLSYNPIPF